jgi:hypothetical protein
LTFRVDGKNHSFDSWHSRFYCQYSSSNSILDFGCCSRHRSLFAFDGIFTIAQQRNDRRKDPRKLKRLWACSFMPDDYLRLFEFKFYWIMYDENLNKEINGKHLTIFDSSLSVPFFMWHFNTSIWNMTRDLRGVLGGKTFSSSLSNFSITLDPMFLSKLNQIHKIF